MVSINLEECLTTRRFEYGDHTIQITIELEHTRPSGGRIDYGRGGKGYYRTVIAEAYHNDDKNISESEPDASDETMSRIRTEPYKPNISVPDDPSLSLSQKIAILFTNETTEDVKQNIRDDKKQKFQESYISSGPAISLTEQIEETVRPVLEALDTRYNLFDKDIEVDIDVTIEYLESKTSWDDIETATENIADTVTVS